MFSVYFYALVSVLVVSLLSFIGIFTLSLKREVLGKCVFLLVSLAVGALIGDAFIHLIPEAFEGISNATYVSLSVIAGILIFFVIEKGLHWHHHHFAAEDVPEIHATGRMILISDGAHNFIDGLIIGVSYLVSIEVGIATTLAIIFHEIPQEIGDFGVLVHSGYTRAKALWLNFFSALFAVVGTIFALLVGGVSETMFIWLIPVAAGGFIYIAMSDLIPEMQKIKSVKYSILQFIAVLVGIAIMFLLLAVE